MKNPDYDAATHHCIFAIQFLPGGPFHGLTLEQAIEKLDEEILKDENYE